jgi:hypothetical protein
MNPPPDSDGALGVAPEQVLEPLPVPTEDYILEGRTAVCDPEQTERNVSVYHWRLKIFDTVPISKNFMLLYSVKEAHVTNAT